MRRSVGQDKELGSQLVELAEVEDALRFLRTSSSFICYTAVASNGIVKVAGAIPEQLNARQRHPTRAQRDTAQSSDVSSLLFRATIRLYFLAPLIM